jgi:hypothetical protein
LLNQHSLGIPEQCAFHEEQCTVVLEAVDQYDVTASQVVAGLTPFQLFIEAGRQAQASQSHKFRSLTLFLAVDLADSRIHFPIVSEWLRRGGSTGNRVIS